MHRFSTQPWGKVSGVCPQGLEQPVGPLCGISDYDVAGRRIMQLGSNPPDEDW